MKTLRNVVENDKLFTITMKVLFAAIAIALIAGAFISLA